MELYLRVAPELYLKRLLVGGVFFISRFALMTNTIANTAELMRVLGESTRLRLAFVLGEYSLSVAELTELTGLAQSRISSHLAVHFDRTGLHTSSCMYAML
mgnify:CR=1 FL=1